MGRRSVNGLVTYHRLYEQKITWYCLIAMSYLNLFVHNIITIFSFLFDITIDSTIDFINSTIICILRVCLLMTTTLTYTSSTFLTSCEKAMWVSTILISINSTIAIFTFIVLFILFSERMTPFVTIHIISYTVTWLTNWFMLLLRLHTRWI